MAVVLELSNVKCFVLKANELHFYLPLTVYVSHEYISNVINVWGFYNHILSTVSGFYHVQKFRNP